jgi:phosphohistidine phosphatase
VRPAQCIGKLLLFLRHGEAEEDHGDDAGRRLTAKGERQARAAGRALVGMGAQIDACLASPKVRADETARLACEALSLEPETAIELRGGSFDSLSLAASRGNVLLVGHEPDFSNEIARLTGGKVKLRKGGLAVVDGSTLQALLRSRDLAALAESSG